MATVLVVDDRATNREIARATLDHGGYQVLEACEGRQALDIAKANHPDLVLADVLMPGMDGYEFVRHLRTDPDTADIPVLFYTANYRAEEVGPLAAMWGVSGVVSKSADPAQLLEAVRAARQHRPAPVGAAESITFGARHLHTVNAKLVEKVEALDASEARFTVMAEASPMGIVIGDLRGAATYVNPRLGEITGKALADLLDDGWLCCLGPEHRPAFQDAVRHGVGADGLRYHSGIAVPESGQRWLTVLVRSIYDTEDTPAGFVAMIDDVTEEVKARERRRAEEKEREAEARRQVTARFDSLARLSGGIAHDFNNLLNVIMSADELAKEAIIETHGNQLAEERYEELLNDLDQIYRAGQRAAHLTHQLLTFGGREAVTPVVVDVNTLVAEAADMIRDALDQRVTVTTELEPALHRVLVDAGQFARVLRNLTANSGDAMPDGGRLHLRTRNARMEAAGPVAGLPPGEYAHISVTDTGHGMPTEVIEQAMEPFFTTKPRGQGTGLGLATAYGVVNQAGGHLAIDSTPGQGTTVHIYLPATRAVPTPARPVTAPPPAAGQTILLAEDDDGLRDIITRLLSRAGYRVLPTADGREALAVAAQHAENDIHALVTDVVMPNMNGRELADALRRVRPSVAVLYMSGYAAPIMTQQGLLDPGVNLLGKPFTQAELLSAVYATVSGQPAESTSAA